MIEPKNLVFLVAAVLAAIPIGLWLALYRTNHMEEQGNEAEAIANVNSHLNLCKFNFIFARLCAKNTCDWNIDRGTF